MNVVETGNKIQLSEVRKNIKYLIIDDDDSRGGTFSSTYYTTRWNILLKVTVQ